MDERPPPPPQRRHPGRTAIAVIAIAFFFAPLGLRAVGVTARPFENRPLATFPATSDGWKAFDQATQFFVDRLPLREQAVRANARASEHVFDAPPIAGNAATAGALPFEKPATKPADGAPAPGAGVPAKGLPGSKILIGKDGWLFLEDELGRACNPFIAWTTAMERWEQMLAIIRDSGRDVVLVVSPDKSTVYPEYLPDAYPERDCLQPGRRATWQAIEGSGDPGVLGLREAMLADKQAPPNETYFPKDSHWNTAGGVLAVRATLQRLDQGVAVREAEIVKGRASYTGDLTNLIGAPEEGQSPSWTIKRPGLPTATSAPETWPEGGAGELTRRPAGGPPVLKGRTLFLHDSFGVAMRDALGSYTRSLSTMAWYVKGPPPALIAGIESADTVILQTAERDLNYKVSDGAIVTPAFLTALRKALAR